MKKIFSVMALCAACVMLTACNKTPAGFDDLKLVRTGFADREVYFDLESLEERSDVAVVGKFIGDAEQNVEYHYSEYLGKDVLSIVTSMNNIEVTSVLMGDVNVGDTLKIGQMYGVVDGELITFSNLTPMQKGDEWVFFLTYDPDFENSYWCTGDSDGRYPIKASENSTMTLSACSDLGVYSEADFNREIYNELVEKYNV